MKQNIKTNEKNNCYLFSTYIRSQTKTCYWYVKVEIHRHLRLPQVHIDVIHALMQKLL